MAIPLKKCKTDTVALKSYYGRKLLNYPDICLLRHNAYDSNAPIK